MESLNLKGYNSSLTVMDIPTRFYDNVLTSFAHHDIVKMIGAYRPAIGLPTAFKGKQNNIDFVIPVGKICAALPIDRTGSITIGGGSIVEKYYATGEESLKSRGVASPGSITEADNNIGAGETLLGEIYPLPGLYIGDDDLASGYSWPRFVTWNSGFGLPGYDEFNFYAELNIPAGVLVTHAKKWRRGTFLNNVITPTYSLVKENRMVLPYMDVHSVLHSMADADGDPSEAMIDKSGTDVASMILFMHGYWKALKTSDAAPVDNEPNFTDPTTNEKKALAFFRAYRDISKWYTFYWDTGPYDELGTKDLNKFMLNVKPDIYGNYTATDIWAFLVHDRWEFGLNSITTYDGSYDSQLLHASFYNNLNIGKVNSRDFNMPRGFLEYVDAPPGSGLGTDAGGIHPLVYDFVHDFILLFAYHWNQLFSDPSDPEFPFDIKAEDIYNYVVEEHYFGSADIFVEV